MVGVLGVDVAMDSTLRSCLDAGKSIMQCGYIFCILVHYWY